MNCMNCKSVVDVGMEICPNCGFNLRVQRKCFSLSNMYYNLGLDKAEIRDLSGAIDMLRRSLKFNKYNIHARNLLGLVYFETGEAVAALSEWIISKNIMPENNVATEYIATLQAEQAKLDMINQTIKKYNSALKCCRENNEDVAAIQLRKILNQNPKLIKGYHLLALIYIHKGEYEKARKILKKAAKIDKTNSTTLRFLKEVDFQTGTQTSLEPRRFGRRERTEEQREDERERVVSGDTVIIPPTFRETSTAATMLNIGIGLVLGALVVWFLIGPANTQRINRQADEKVVEYSGKMASQEAQLNQLQSQVDSLNETTASAQQQIQTAQDTAASYENLLKAVEAQQQGNTSTEQIDATNINQYLRNQKIISLTEEDYPGFVEELKVSLLAFAADPVQQEKWRLFYQPVIHPTALFCVSVSGWMREFHPAYRRYYENTHTCCRMLKDFMDSDEGAALNATLREAFQGNCDVRTGYYGELEVTATFHKSIYALLPPEKIRKFLEENSDEK